MTGSHPQLPNVRELNRQVKLFDQLWVGCLVLLAWVCGDTRETQAQDRAVLPTLVTSESVPKVTNFGSSGIGDSVEQVCEADAEAGIGDWNVDGWSAYQRMWSELSEDPSNLPIRKYLGLPIGRSMNQTVVIKIARGRSAPNWLGWKSGSYRQVETPHLQIFSRASEKDARAVAADLERTFWVWTQFFFPFWDARYSVAAQLRSVVPSESVAKQLSNARGRLPTRKKIRIVLFNDKQQYVQALSAAVPGIEQSTGFYSDSRQTSFFYPSEDEDAVATRRHELVHQLFLEATDSQLNGETPGRESDFWLAEGIAGYFESLSFTANHATLGGWDSPRLQFARFRILSGRDSLAFSELMQSTQAQVQRRSDLSRWYAFAIAYTHAMLDGGVRSERRFIYDKLAKLYRIPVSKGVGGISFDVPGAKATEQPERSLSRFLSIDDQVLLDNPPTRVLQQLCLAGCQISAEGLKRISPQADLTWLDLSQIPVDARSVESLCPDPSELKQLSLESTRVDDSLAAWLGRASELSELDLSWTKAGDAISSQIMGHAKLKTLWMTGSQISDAAVPNLIQLRGLESLDVQRTRVTQKGLGELKIKRPAWKVNPLELRTQPVSPL